MIIVLKPVLPIVSDMVAHVFWKLEHISTVHSHDGEAHVHQEIMEAEVRDQSGETTSASRYEVLIGPHLIAKASYNFSITPEMLTHETSSLF